VYLQQGYGSKVDIWALGVIAYEIIIGNTPWEDMDEEDAIMNIV